MLGAVYAGGEESRDHAKEPEPAGGVCRAGIPGEAERQSPDGCGGGRRSGRTGRGPSLVAAWRQARGFQSGTPGDLGTINDHHS